MTRNVFKCMLTDRLIEVCYGALDAHDAACKDQDFGVARAALAEIEEEIENARQILDAWELREKKETLK